jgi:hypothetical protein
MTRAIIDIATPLFHDHITIGRGGRSSFRNLGLLA